MKKGLSLAVLIITILVMIILLGVIVINVDDVGEEAAAMKFLNDISMIETKVLVEQYNAGMAENYMFIGTALTQSNPITIGDTIYPYGTSQWYLLNDNDLVNLGVKDIKGTYVVNYTTGDVVSVGGIEVYGMTYYTFDEVAAAIDFQY